MLFRGIVVVSSHLALALLDFFFFNDTATTEIYTLSLHDALPILSRQDLVGNALRFLGHFVQPPAHEALDREHRVLGVGRSEEHTSELQSLAYLVCRLLLEKKKTKQHRTSVGLILMQINRMPVSLS